MKLPSPVKATTSWATVSCPNRYCPIEILIPINVTVHFSQLSATDEIRGQITAQAVPESQPIWDHMLQMHGPALD